jgi:predicted P-loop ATPase
MFVRSIACAIENNVFNKQAFILVGYEQNSGKSTFCRFLCPKVLDEYYSEGFSLDKDGQISLAENLFINLDELAALSKYEINQLKSSFSKDKIKIRRPFEKKATTTPRRASFLGSTNNAEFLTDETGSVRWLCFEISRIDWDYKMNINIDNVWAQAYFLYKTGFKYNLSLEDVTENNLVNRKYQVSTPEAEVIAKKYEPGSALNHDKFLTPFEISKDLNEEYAGPYKFTPVNVGRALTYLGFERVQKRINGDVNPTRGYYVLIKSTNFLATLATSGTEELDF